MEPRAAIVFGAGASGRAAARALLRRGAEVAVAVREPDGATAALAAEGAAILAGDPAASVAGWGPRHAGADAVFSPGIPPSAPEFAAARAAGADAVLLIAAVLDDGALADLMAFARSLSLAALVETHDAREIARAVRLGAEVIGVNCRNLRDFSTDVTLLERLVGEIPSGCVRVAESGMHSAEAILRAKNAGADAFLVGTALMRAASPGAKLGELILRK